MDAGSTFGIYGNLFGWHLFGIIYDFIIGTGLWLIPFIIIMYQAYISNKGGGEGHKYNALGVQVFMEVNVYTAIFVITLFLIPAVTVEKLAVIYNDGATEHVSGDTGTTFDTLDPIIPTEIKIPVGWYSILYITNGFNNAIKQMLPTGQQTRGLMFQVQQVELKTDETRIQYNEFMKNCTKPALARLNRIWSTYSDSQLGNKLRELKLANNAENDEGKYWETDPLFAGNKFYTDYLYNKVPACGAGSADERAGKLSVCLPATGHALTPPAGKSCDTWWYDGAFSGSLYKKLLKEFELGSFEYNGENELYQRLNAKNMLNVSAGLGNKEGNVAQKLIEWVAAFNTNIGNWMVKFVNSVVRFYLPIMHGIITMILVILLPILILSSRYKAETVISLAILYFGITLMTGIWHIGTWIDQVMISAIGGSTPWYHLKGAFNLTEAVWGLISMSIYPIMTYYWIGLMRAMGAGATNALTTSMGTSGTAQSHSSGVSAGKRAGGAAGKANQARKDYSSYAKGERQK